MMYGGMGMGGNIFNYLIFSVIIIVLVILIIGAVFWMFKPKNNNNSKDSKDNSLEILKNRLAKGEISEEEFERLKNHINN